MCSSQCGTQTPKDGRTVQHARRPYVAPISVQYFVAKHGNSTVRISGWLPDPRQDRTCSKKSGGIASISNVEPTVGRCKKQRAAARLLPILPDHCCWFDLALRLLPCCTGYSYELMLLVIVTQLLCRVSTPLPFESLKACYDIPLTVLYALGWA